MNKADSVHGRQLQRFEDSMSTKDIQHQAPTPSVYDFIIGNSTPLDDAYRCFERLVVHARKLEATPSALPATERDAVEITVEDVQEWADGVFAALGTEHARKVTETEMRIAHAINHADDGALKSAQHEVKATPVAWIASRGDTVHHFSVQDGWKVEVVATDNAAGQGTAVADNPARRSEPPAPAAPNAAPQAGHSVSADSVSGDSPTQPAAAAPQWVVDAALRKAAEVCDTIWEQDAETAGAGSSAACALAIRTMIGKPLEE